MKRKALASMLCMAFLCLCALPACRGGAGGIGSAALSGAEPADELVIYYADHASLLVGCLEEYRYRYPDVEVRVEYFRAYGPGGNLNPDIAEAYTGRVTAELMAGEGPDVLFLSTAFFKDIQKLAGSGSLLDLNPYFEADPDFNEGAYYAPVFNLGLLGGKRLFVPEVFRIPATVGGEEILRAAGMNPARMMGSVPLLGEVARALPALSRNPGFSGVFGSAQADRRAIEMLLSVAAASAVDAEAGEALPDADFLRAFFAALKPFYTFTQRRPAAELDGPSSAGGLPLFKEWLDIARLEGPMEDMAAFWDECYIALPNGKLPLSVPGGYRFVLEEELALAADPTPVVIPLTGSSGEPLAIADRALAVPAGAKNPQNAYNFIKVILETQQNSLGTQHSAYEAVNKRSNLIYVNNNTFGGKHIYSGENLTAERVTGAVFVNPALTEILMTCMTPFLNGEQSYDSCEARLRERLEIYLSE